MIQLNNYLNLTHLNTFLPTTVKTKEFGGYKVFEKVLTDGILPHKFDTYEEGAILAEALNKTIDPTPHIFIASTDRDYFPPRVMPVGHRFLIATKTSRLYFQDLDGGGMIRCMYHFAPTNTPTGGSYYDYYKKISPLPYVVRERKVDGKNILLFCSPDPIKV